MLAFYFPLLSPPLYLSTSLPSPLRCHAERISTNWGQNPSPTPTARTTNGRLTCARSSKVQVISARASTQVLQRRPRRRSPQDPRSSRSLLRSWAALEFWIQSPESWVQGSESRVLGPGFTGSSTYSLCTVFLVCDCEGYFFFSSCWVLTLSGEGRGGVGGRCPMRGNTLPAMLSACLCGF